jgi:hypothetical protein
MPVFTLQYIKNEILDMNESLTHDNMIRIFNGLSIPVAKISSFLENIDIKYTNRVEHIKDTLTTHDCSVCLDKPVCPTFSKCCMNIYCGQCILKSMFTNNKCPTCRSYLSHTTIQPVILDINDNVMLNNMSTHHVKSKIEMCVESIVNTKGKTVIYCAFDNVFYQVRHELEKIGINCELLPSNIVQMKKVINNFIDDKIDVLCISDCDVISGLSLHSVSHLIFYHEVPFFDSKNNILHLVQRLGRDYPLKITNLIAKLVL